MAITDQLIAVSEEAWEVVYEAACIITSNLDIGQVYERFATEMRRLVDFDRAEINVVDQGSRTGRTEFLFPDAGPASAKQETRPLADLYSGYVVHSQRHLILADISEDSQFWNARLLLAEGFRSGIFFPLLSQGRALATLSFLSRRVGAYGERERAILDRIAPSVTSALRNARMYQEAREKAKEIEVIGAVSDILNSGLDTGHVYEKFAREVRTLVDFDWATVNVIDESGMTRKIAYLSQQSGTFHALGQSLPLDGTATGYVVNTRRNLILDDLGQGLVEFSTGDSFRTGMSSAIIVPVISKGKVLATLELGSRQGLVEFSTGDSFRTGMSSAIIVPVISKGKVLATLELGSRRPSFYGSSEGEVLRRLASLVAPALENSLLLKEVVHCELALRDSELGAKEVERLQKVDQIRKELIATVSHELRTPLASIKGYTSTLLQSDVTWEPKLQQEFLTIIDKEADCLDRLISDLLTMSQLEAGVLSLKLEKIDPVDILKDMEIQLKTQVSMHHLNLQAPDDLAQVLADRHRVAQVITNLVSNAAKFSKPGSEIAIGATKCGEEVVVTVCDQGTGIPRNRLDRVFEPFYSLDGTPTATGSGFGLGLAISRKLVEAQGGKIWVESEPGRGSTFYFSMPIVERTEH